LVLVELAAFGAFWPLAEGDAQRFKGLSLVQDAHEAYLSDAPRQLGFPPSRAEELRAALASTQKALSGYWWKVGTGVLVGLDIGVLTFGVAAPFVAGAIGGVLGLSGAAALNAAFAALGGGAVAAGGIVWRGGWP
jgi:hypothetical protein